MLQFPNGSANLTYLLSFGDRQFVLRRPPFGEIAPGAHDMSREFKVLSKLWTAYDRAPRAHLLCEDHSVAGAPFTLQEYRRGEVVWAELPPSLADEPDSALRIGFATVDALADLHLVDYEELGLTDLGKPEGYLARQVGGWRNRWSRVATSDHDPRMTAIGERLAASVPNTQRPTLLHNDFKVDNCQFASGAPDRVISVFDWDMATLGDPLADLGTLLNYWPDPSDTPEDRSLHVAGLERLGLPTRQELIERYSGRTTFDTRCIAWYEAFAAWRTCIILQQLHQRFVHGESTDERMAARGDYIPMLSRRAERLLG